MCRCMSVLFMLFSDVDFMCLFWLMVCIRLCWRVVGVMVILCRLMLVKCCVMLLRVVCWGLMISICLF